MSIDDGSQTILDITLNEVEKNEDYQLSSLAISKLIEILFLYVLKQNCKIYEVLERPLSCEEEI